MQNVALAAPLMIGGTLKIAYDLLLYRVFRDLRPPEEAAPASRTGGEPDAGGLATLPNVDRDAPQ